jgi:hypothetical protein
MLRYSIRFGFTIVLQVMGILLTKSFVLDYAASRICKY